MSDIYTIVEVIVDYDYVDRCEHYKSFGSLGEATEYLDNLSAEWLKYIAELEKCNKKTIEAYWEWANKQKGEPELPGATGCLIVAVPYHIQEKFPRPMWNKPNPNNLHLIKVPPTESLYV